MKRIIFYASITLMAGLALTNIYNSMVDATSWCNNMPDSIATARAYFSVSDPGDFFRIFSPINQLLALLTLILFWKADRKIRLYLALALFTALAADAMTFGYFYPRNTILFTADIQGQLREITDACQQWQSMNWIRSCIILLGVVFQFLALDKLLAGNRPVSDVRV